MGDSTFLAVCLNPTLQKTLRFSSITKDHVNRTANHRLDASGKGINVARVLGQLGKRALHLTQLGGSLQPLFLQLCEEDSLSIRWAESHSPIRFCYTLIDGSDRSVTELVEEALPVDPMTEGRILDLFEQSLPERGTLTISGTKANGFSDMIFPTMTKMAKERGLRVILDIRGKDLTESLPFEPDLIKPNLAEFLSTYIPNPPQEPNRLKEAVIQVAQDLERRYHCRLVLTRGAKAVWVVSGGEFRELEFPSVPPVNTTGSGDAFTAGLASALDDGRDLYDAVAEGARCGRLNAQYLKPGTIVDN
jgi:1-phosphofructokinase family hexose kinase